MNSFIKRTSRPPRVVLLENHGLIALGVTTAFLVMLLSSVIGTGVPGFFQTVFVADVLVDKAKIDPNGKGDEATLRAGDYTALARSAISHSPKSASSAGNGPAGTT
jgi:hypothetical protein